MTTENISKIDAVCRQLDTAITLWFQESDPVAIHTLACASHQIIHDIIHHIGGHDPLFDSSYIKSEFTTLAKRCFHRHYNFFKHADHDPDRFIEFDASAPEYFILFSILGLEQLGIKRNLLRFTFIVYFGFHTPDLFTPKTYKSFRQDFHVEILPEINLSRRVFFEKFQEGVLSTTGHIRP